MGARFPIAGADRDHNANSQIISDRSDKYRDNDHKDNRLIGAGDRL